MTALLIKALAGLALVSGPGLAGEAAERLAPCLAQVQARFHAGKGSDPAARWKGLAVLQAADARCLSTVTSSCTLRKAQAEACFDDLLGFAAQRRSALLRDLPDRLEEGPPGLPQRYAEWRDFALDRQARPDLRGCRFGSDAPASACPALEAGAAYIEARDWARVVMLVTEALE